MTREQYIEYYETNIPYLINKWRMMPLGDEKRALGRLIRKMKKNLTKWMHL